MVTVNMDFCPRCGRYLKDGEYQCPECGNMVRRPEPVAPMPGEFHDSFATARPEQVDIKRAIFEKYFFIAFAIAFAASFAVTYYWRFTMLFFCIPLFLPMGRISIAAGALLGLTVGSGCAMLGKAYLFSNIIFNGF